MATLEKIKAKLPGFIVDNRILNDLIGPIGYSLDQYILDADALRDALNAENSSPATLDALGADYRLVRHYRDTNRIMAIRIMNAIKTHQERGTQFGLYTEGREILLATPCNRIMRYVLGVDPIGTGYAFGGIGAEWIHLWGDTPEPEADQKNKVKNLIPLNIKAGMDFINAYEAEAGYVSIRDPDLTDSDTYAITNVGFYSDRNTLIPRQESCSYEFGNIDLGATVGNYQWLVDWIDYAAWDVEHDLVVEARFSSDEEVWSAWAEYLRNQLVPESEIERYAQFRITLTMNTYRSLNHYVFRSFILKGLTTSQQRYGVTEKGIVAQMYAGN